MKVCSALPVVDVFVLISKILFCFFKYTNHVFICIFEVYFPPTGGPGCWAVGWSEKEGKVEQQY